MILIWRWKRERLSHERVTRPATFFVLKIYFQFRFWQVQLSLITLVFCLHSHPSSLHYWRSSFHRSITFCLFSFAPAFNPPRLPCLAFPVQNAIQLNIRDSVCLCAVLLRLPKKPFTAPMLMRTDGKCVGHDGAEFRARPSSCFSATWCWETGERRVGDGFYVSLERRLQHGNEYHFWC